MQNGQSWSWPQIKIMKKLCALHMRNEVSPTYLKIQKLGNPHFFCLAKWWKIIFHVRNVLCRRTKLTWFSLKTSPSWKILCQNPWRIHGFCLKFTYMKTIKNNLLACFFGKIYLTIRPKGFIFMGRKKHHQRLSLVDAALAKRRLHGMGAQQGIWTRHRAVSVGVVGSGRFVWYILKAYPFFSLVWMCKLVGFFFCCLSTWEA